MFKVHSTLIVLLCLAFLQTVNGQEAITDTTIIHRTAMDMRLVRLNYRAYAHHSFGSHHHAPLHLDEGKPLQRPHPL